MFFFFLFVIAYVSKFNPFFNYNEKSSKRDFKFNFAMYGVNLIIFEFI